jgi:hypothetical protein
MNSLPSDILGIIRLWLGPLRGGEQTTQLLLRGPDGVAPHRWEDLLGAAAPPPQLPVLGPSGRQLLDLLPTPDTEHRPAIGHRPTTVERLVVLDPATAQTTDTGFEQRPDRWLNYALSTDGTALAVGATQRAGDGADLTVSVLRGDDLHTTSVERTFPGHAIGPGHIDHMLQWSPDGSRLAMTVREPGDQYDNLHILDTQTLDTVLTSRTWLMGSLSWSSDSTRIAVLKYDEPRILHLDDGRLEPLPWLKGERSDPPRQPMILGLLDRDRAIVLRQTRKRARVLLCDLTTGEGPTVMTIPLNYGDWPVYLTVSRAWEDLT